MVRPAGIAIVANTWKIFLAIGIPMVLLHRVRVGQTMISRLLNGVTLCLTTLIVATMVAINIATGVDYFLRNMMTTN